MKHFFKSTHDLDCKILSSIESFCACEPNLDLELELRDILNFPFVDVLLQKKILDIRRNFVQRVVFHKFKTVEPFGLKPSYDFVSQEGFVRDFETKQIDLTILEEYVAWAIFHPLGRRKHKDDVLFFITSASNIDFVKMEPFVVKEQTLYPSFELREQKISDDFCGFHKSYCLYCHKNGKDFCRTENKQAKKAGCPLGQKISQMNFFCANGFDVIAFILVVLDNPLCILTGHRICNDCKAACIFQKQTQVDVPSIESELVLKILSLEFGFEFYCYLVNLLHSKKRDLKDKNVLVAGAGPAGISACLELLLRGSGVVLIDMLEIDKIDRKYINQPVKNALDVKLSPFSGFGGVMKYGITARWNKNLLMLARILLERFERFLAYGLVRYGRTINEKIATEMGFDEIIFCLGAAYPKVLSPNVIGYGSEYGIFTASDFLMTLHQDGSGSDYLKNVKPPVVIVGAGLTATDCATEVVALLKSDQVFVCSRAQIESSKAYLTNDFEVDVMLKSGVKFVEGVNIKSIEYLNGRVCGVVFENDFCIKCKTIIFAQGTSPNIFCVDKKQPILLGDLNEKYSGSVVKALASGRDVIRDIQITQHNGRSFEDIVLQFCDSKIVFNEQVGNRIFKIGVFAPLVARVAKVLNFCKIRINSSTLALSVAKISGDILTFFVEAIGSSSLEFCLLEVGNSVSIMGPSGRDFEVEKYDFFVVNDLTRFIVLELGIDKNKLLDFDSAETIIEKDVLVMSKQGYNLKIERCLVDDFYYGFVNCCSGGVCSRCFDVETKSYRCL